MIKNIFFLLCVILLMSCEKQKGNEKFPNAHQLILFQIEYINHAWGFSHNGFLIDSSGVVTSFKYPHNWNYPDSTGYMGESAMEDNINQLDTISFTINKSEMLKYFDKLEKISDGELIVPAYRAYDAGKTDFSGFIYDSNKKQYKHVLIKRVGDFPIDNNSPEAEEVFRWLLRVYSTKPAVR
jgi:hypothetical protein